MNLLVGLCLGAAVWVPLLIGQFIVASNILLILALPLRAVRSVSDPTFDILWGAISFPPFALYRFVSPHLVLYCSLLSSTPQHLHHACLSFFNSSIPLVTSETASLLNSTTPATLIDNSTLLSSSFLVDNATSTLSNSSLPLAATFVRTLHQSIQSHWAQMGLASDPTHQVLCIALGYSTLALTGWLYVHITSKNEYSQTVERMVRHGIAQQLLMLKVCFFIFVEVSS